MLKSRIFILQLLGILLLLACYLIKNEPDRLSLMSFNVNPHSHCVIKKSAKPTTNNAPSGTSVSSHHHSSRRAHAPKFIPFEIALPANFTYTFNEQEKVVFSSPIPQNYFYLFFEEINPPPPKLACNS